MPLSMAYPHRPLPCSLTYTMELPLPQIAVLCACLGIVSHVGYFIRGEHLSSALYYFSAAFAVPGLSVLLLVTCVSVRPLQAVVATSVGYAAFLGALYTSMVVYRLLFHPLRHFPGPKLAPIIQRYHAHQVAKGNSHFYLAQLHAKYGDYVSTITAVHLERSKTNTSRINRCA